MKKNLIYNSIRKDINILIVAMSNIFSLNSFLQGTYKATAKLTDENEDVLMCGFAEFVL